MNIEDMLPQIYKDLNKKGYTNYRNFKSSADVNQNYLWFIDLTWFTYDQIIQEEEFFNINMIPFATTEGGDCWCLDLNHKNYVPIVCCYHGDGEGVYYAKTLEATLFRQILDFACNEFTDGDNKDENSIMTGRQVILNWISELKRYFPNEWICELSNIINSEDYAETEPGYFEMISESKYDELIKKYIDFELLDKTFIWTKEDTRKFYK